MIFMQGVDITQAIGRVGLKVAPVLGPEIARATASGIWAQNRRVTDSADSASLLQWENTW